MQAENLTQLKRQIVLLDAESKQNLAQFLAEELSSENESVSSPVSDEGRQSQIEWLKQNREKYAGKYVALSGNELVGEGKTLREAREKASEKGFPNPFVTFVYSENDVPFGGW
jgi:hypothetical protein